MQARCVVGGGSECTAQDEQVQKDRLIDAGECEKVCQLLRILYYYIYTYFLQCTLAGEGTTFLFGPYSVD